MALIWWILGSLVVLVVVIKISTKNTASGEKSSVKRLWDSCCAKLRGKDYGI